MSSPGVRSPNRKPAAGGNVARVISGQRGSQQKLRVLSDDAAARAVPSIAMPQAKTELTEILAGDDLLCVRRPRPTTSIRPGADASSSLPSVVAEAQTEAPRAENVDDDLAGVIDAWPDLPRNVRAAVLAMIRETAFGGA